MLQSFIFGLEDAFHPFYAASFLIFTVVLSLFGISRGRLILFGSLYLIAYFIGLINVHIGVFDTLYLDEIFFGYLRMTYVGIGGLFLLIGAIHLVDWYRLRCKGCRKEEVIICPAFASLKGKSKERGQILQRLWLLLMVMLVLLLGITMSILAGVVPQEMIFILFSHLLAQGDGSRVTQIYIMYLIGLAFPLVLYWLICGIMQTKTVGIKTLAYYKAVCAALFLAFGSSLVSLIMTL